jgi:steroid 5-alpha reductase family enzyme
MIPSIFILNKVPAGFSAFSAIGTSVWVIGLLLETIADQQKSAFLANPKNKGRWMESGLWAYTRHPNYLGEILVWTGIFLFALPYLSVWEAVVSLISPLWIMILLIFISGIPLAEASAEKKWGNVKSYKDYKERVPTLLPRLRN